MAMPTNKAMALAKDMASKGITGSILMKKPMGKAPPSSPDLGEDDDAGEDYSDYGTRLLSALESKDPKAVGQVVHDLVERCMDEAQEPDGDEG